MGQLLGGNADGGGVAAYPNDFCGTIQRCVLGSGLGGFLFGLAVSKHGWLSFLI
jgi:hypothetical protein